VNRDHAPDDDVHHDRDDYHNGKIAAKTAKSLKDGQCHPRCAACTLR
jgi:hypothetical protein